MRKREDEVFPNAAGIDIGASSHWVAVSRHLAEGAGCESVREVGAMTEDLNALAAWLVGLGVDTVAVESTGVYWIPVFEVLEQHGLKVWLVDARQMKYVPGRKSDVQDCQWLQKLMSLGLLRASSATVACCWCAAPRCQTMSSTSCTPRHRPSAVGVRRNRLDLRLSGDNDPGQLTSSWSRWIRTTVASAAGTGHS